MLPAFMIMNFGRMILEELKSKSIKFIQMKRLIFFVSLLSFGISVLGQQDTYKVYALKYLDGGKEPAAGWVAGATINDSIDICEMYWFLKGNNGRNILVDVGFIDSSGNSTYIRPDLVLNDINCKPSDITDIVITHPHFDHIGGLPLYPAGKIWMQRKDFDYFVADAWQDSNFRAGFNPTDVKNLIEVSLNGRLNLINGDDIEIIPGIRVYTGSTHTKENQYLLVNSESKNQVLLASDAIWFYLNLQRMVPIKTFVFDPAAYVNAMKRMKTLVSDEKYIIPGHDNLLFSKFERVTDRVVIIK